jgi:Bacterial Ig-like domain (group 3)
MQAVNPSVLGQNVSWPCSVTSPDGTPTGMITYTLDGNPLGTISTTDAPWSGAGLTVGAHVLTCSFAAQGNFVASSAAVTQTVGIAPTVAELSSSANPIAFSGSATFTALVDTGGSVAPTASVAFTSNGVAIGSGTVSTVTTTNLMNNSDVSTWTASGPTLTANASAAPGGTLTATHVVSPANSGCCINIGMTSSSAWIPVDTYTYSVWLRSDSSAAVQVSLRTGPGGESDTLPTMTPTWTR